MPPVQCVAGFELMARSAQNMLPRAIGIGEQKCQHILQLVAEAIGAASLIKGSAGQDSTGQVLIGQPLVDHHVKGRIGRLDLNAPESLFPKLPQVLQG